MIHVFTFAFAYAQSTCGDVKTAYTLTNCCTATSDTPVPTMVSIDSSQLSYKMTFESQVFMFGAAFPTFSVLDVVVPYDDQKPMEYGLGSKYIMNVGTNPNTQLMSMATPTANGTYLIISELDKAQDGKIQWQGTDKLGLPISQSMILSYFYPDETQEDLSNPNFLLGKFFTYHKPNAQENQRNIHVHDIPNKQHLSYTIYFDGSEWQAYTVDLLGSHLFVETFDGLSPGMLETDKIIENKFP